MCLLLPFLQPGFFGFKDPPPIIERRKGEGRGGNKTRGILCREGRGKTPPSSSAVSNQAKSKTARVGTQVWCALRGIQYAYSR